MVRSAKTGNSTVKISRRAADRLRAGHVWVYRSDVISQDEIAAGALVDVADERGKSLGSGLWSSSSVIALRLLSPQPIAADTLPALMRGRLEEALDYRQRVVRDSDAYRLVFSEGDRLPGLIVDRYNDVLTLQALTQAFDQARLKDAVVAWLGERFPESTLVERVEPRIRELEKLPPSQDHIIITGKKRVGADVPVRPAERSTAEDSEVAESGRTIVTMNGVRMHYDALAGQKTGAFLDQRENYSAAQTYARGEALDVFCYQGGFALHLARVCDTVTGVDSSRPALEIAERNADLNREALGGREIEWIEANAFDLLRDYAAAARQYDTIVLDPPPFARSSRNRGSALRAYKELNLRALKMLRPGGTLVTCSCSYHVSEPEFMEAVLAAAQDARRMPRLLERRGAANDHPYIPFIPETGYLKCLLINVTG